MLSTRLALRTAMTAVTSAAALAVALPAAAQETSLPPLPELPPMGDSAIVAPVAAQAPAAKAPMSQAEIDTLPAEYRSLPVGGEISDSSMGTDGVETITRTRRIASRAPVQTKTQNYQGHSYPGGPAQPVAYYHATHAAPAYHTATYAPAVLDRESWIAECERRTEGRDKNSTGTIIGGLLGAIGGGILGNRVWDSERLAGTLIGGGLGGLAGGLIGSLFNGDKKDDLYDCEAALSTYLDQHSQYGAPRIASRVIAAPVAPAPVAYPAYSYAQPTYYQPAQTMVMVPVTTYQPQRVIVRETVREEMVPGAARVLPQAAPAPVPAPSPKLIKQAPQPVRVPAPSPKLIKN